MNTRDIATEYRLSHWAGVLQEHHSSGISIKEFCKRAGFREHVYYYWQRKLRETTCEELAVRAQNVAVVTEPSPAPTGWAACQRIDSPLNRSGLVVEVGGCRVHVEPETDLALLLKVCQALKSPC